MLVKTKIRFLFFVLLFAAVLFTTCDSPMGMGKQIDFEPPVLTLDPKPPTPFYVRLGAQLTGTVTDNEGVDRVILRDAVTGEQLFTAVLLPNNRWQIDLVFSEEQNGETITVDVVAFDFAGNSDASSIAQVVLTIDIMPPLVQYIEIKRTDTRMSRPEPYDTLKELEILDQKGEKKENLYRYQNGWFYMSAVVDEKETKVDIEFSSLNIYDTREPNLPLLSLPIDETYTAYSPRWTVKEEDIINAGVSIFGSSYKTNYYEKGERYYYRITVFAIDKSQNESVMVHEDEGYICLWAVSDEPKGIYDPSIGTVVSRGTPLPVDFYDDDSLRWAYTGLLTKEQWDGYKLNELGEKEDVFVAPGAKIPEGTNEQKLLWLKERLTGTAGDSIELGAGQPVYNWRFDKHSGDSTKLTEPVTELIKFNPLEPKSLDEKIHFHQTGRDNNDYGDYVIFTLAADRKLDPHSGNGPEWTNKDIWKGNVFPLSVIDENVPLIVFDTESGCPEENTFPKLYAEGGSGNEYFTIKGYTLRENSRGESDSDPANQNKVTTFRMAWIPFNMPDSEGKPAADSYILAVQRALSAINYPASIDANASLQGIQHWEFKEGGGAGYGDFVPERLYHGIPENTYYKQDFEKKFSVLKNRSDNIKGAYKNFTYSDNHENETKLFIFYAVDNMGHEVFRQLRLLGMKTPPSLTVYDITNKVLNTEFSGLPDPNSSSYISGGILNQDYYDALNAYNRDVGYNKLKNVPIDEKEDKSISLQVYPRGTIIKYWVKAAESGEIVVKSITMKDITFTDAKDIGSNFDNTNTQNLSFCEQYPDVTRRTFLFEAIDELDNKASVQRTITVTNAARLENITTTEQSGLYGEGSTITLKANFSSQIYVTATPPSSASIELNVRYKILSGGEANYVYRSIPCDSIPTDSSPALSLDFTFTVPNNASDVLWTAYDDEVAFPPPVDRRPITLGGNTKIIDSIRGDSAFIPGYQFDTVLMPNWNNNTNTLQKNKKIELDGTPPRITSVVADAGGKAIYPTTPTGYYLKTGDTLNLTLTADEEIKVSGEPVLQYYVRDFSTNDEYGPFTTTAFKYKQPGLVKNQLIFSLPITVANFTFNGVHRDVVQLFGISLLTPGGIRDNANNIAANTASFVPADSIYIKQNASIRPFSEMSEPTASNASPSGTATIGTNSANTLYYNGNPRLTIEPVGSWPDYIEYSTNGGNTWTVYDALNPPRLSNGTYTVQARVQDRAGNKGAITEQKVQIKGNFPNLVTVGAVQPNGWYTAGKTLEFNLNFEDEVTFESNTNVAIRLTNAKADAGESNQKLLYADAGQAGTYSNTIKFSWTNIGENKEMQEGLYISSIVLTGLKDRFGNIGKSNTSIPMNTDITGIDGSPVKNLPAGGIKVDAKNPEYTIGIVSGGVSSDNKTITLTFSEKVMIGSGVIAVRPYVSPTTPADSYRIPAVLENDGYTDANGTFIAGFYDIYNNSALTAADRQTLTQSASAANPSMTNLALDTRTGQSAGPYIKLTHGLKEGAGYTGAYTDTTPGANGPNPEGVAGTATARMIPDTSTKWVLDYRYSIDNASTSNTQYASNANNTNTLLTPSTTVVPAIRDVLTKAKWRWQEIELASIKFDAAGTVATITLPEPLLEGLKWALTIPAGAFADPAGNVAEKAASVPNDYWFWSKGVQAPVIRVNRKSFDARTANWQNITGRTYSVPTDLGGPGGWGIGDFNTVHYRIESETPGAAIWYATDIGANQVGSITAAWTGNIAAVGGTQRTWQNPGVNTTTGEWVLPNLVRRSGSGTYTVTENGFSTVRQIMGDYHGYRSYNRDILKSDLDGKTLALFSGSGGNTTQGSFTYDSGGKQASKNYVVAEARITNGGTPYTSGKSYEGVFRSVIALNQASFGGGLGGANRNNNPIMVQGSNVKNGMPSVAGFPVYDAGETGDNRFLKIYYYESYTANTSGQLYWVSTEIVSEWYNLNCGRRASDNDATGGTHQSSGDVNNYLISGYGDLTYSYNQR